MDSKTLSNLLFGMEGTRLTLYPIDSKAVVYRSLRWLVVPVSDPPRIRVSSSFAHVDCAVITNAIIIDVIIFFIFFPFCYMFVLDIISYGCVFVNKRLYPTSQIGLRRYNII